MNMNRKEDVWRWGKRRNEEVELRRREDCDGDI